MAKVRDLVTIDHITAARERIKESVRHTPLEESRGLSRITGGVVRLKLENLQITGSFKPRGSFNRLRTLSEEERNRGVVAPTAGNHGIGLAFAAQQLGIGAHVYLPESADPAKVRALEHLGANLQFYPSIEDARQEALRQTDEWGLTFLSAYNDPAMVAGAGTVGLEILDDWPDAEVVLAGVGGGGMAAGLGIVMEARSPGTEVWGVQPANSATFVRWLEAGRIVPVALSPSVAEGLSGTIDPETITFPLLRRVVRRMLTVSEEQIVGAMRWMLEHHGYLVEPSGAAAVAAALYVPGALAGRNVAVLVSGRNVSAARLKTVLEMDVPSIRSPE